MADIHLFSYKLTHDTGFAPNPFWGYLTLATCKPGIRQSKGLGDWIAGFTSTSLCGDRVGEERLVFLMQVAEKVPIGRYFEDRKFCAKIPDPDADEEIYRSGDNIYRPKCANATHPRDFEQLRNPNHWDGNSTCGIGESKKRDTSGKNVLIAKRFAYFGRKALLIPLELRPAVPYGVSRYGSESKNQFEAQAFIDYVFEQAAGQQVIAPPHDWPKDDDSWKREK